MKYLSVCSGIEAATVAWHGLGWEPVAFAEIEAFPAAVLAHHYPTVPNLGDLTKYREWPEELLVEVDLLVGGTPCQAFSVAGLRRSLDDERGNLSLTYVNLFHHINEVRKRHGRSPAIALWENVPGVLSTKDNAFGCFIGGLLGCDEAPETESGKWDKAGFLSSETVRVGYRVLDAQYFGVAQRRRRVFLAAVPCELVERFGERACPSEILSLRESVLGNPPTRGTAWEGVARATAAGTASGGRGVERCGESRGQDDVVISRGIAVDTYNQTISDTSIPVRVGNAKDSLPAVIDAPPVCGTLSDGAHMGGGLTGRTHTRGESCPCVARTLTQRMHKGFDSTLDSQTPIVTHGGVFDGEPTCFHPTQDTICSTDGSERGQAVAVRTANTGANGHGVADEVTHTIDQVQGQAIAFKPGQSEAAGGTFVTEEFTPTMQAQNNGSTAVPAVAFTKAKRAQSSEDDESWVPGEVAPTQNQFDQGDTRATTVVVNDCAASIGQRMRGQDDSCADNLQVVAFTQNSRDEVRQINGDGRVAGALNADAGMHQTNYVAFAQNQLGEVRTNPDVMGTVNQNQNQNASGRNTPMVCGFAPLQGGRSMPVTQESPTLEAGTGNKAPAIQTAMQVRRLTPRECEFLQGFPPDYTDVTYRKKPAADGPRYRALGNSMAVPCMWWLGKRIHEATQCD